MPNVLMMGHGCDIVTERGNDDIPMPDNCIYVTVVLCGFISWKIGNIVYAFHDPIIRSALQDPVNNIDKLNRYFNTNSTGQNTIHIHSPGSTYNESMNTFIYDGPTGKLFKSGLYALNDCELLNLSNDGNLHKFDANSAAAPPFSQGDINTIYEHSLIKPVSRLRGSYESIDAFKKQHESELSRTMSQLFLEFPGIYYNFTCRPACDKRYQALTERRRQVSIPRNRGIHAPNINAQLLAGNPEKDRENEWFKHRIAKTIKFLTKATSLSKAKISRIKDRLEPIANSLSKSMQIDEPVIVARAKSDPKANMDVVQAQSERTSMNIIKAQNEARNMNVVKLPVMAKKTKHTRRSTKRRAPKATKTRRRNKH
jgi:hypothetical protein